MDAAGRPKNLRLILAETVALCILAIVIGAGLCRLFEMIANIFE